MCVETKALKLLEVNDNFKEAHIFKGMGQKSNTGKNGPIRVKENVTREVGPKKYH